MLFECVVHSSGWKPIVTPFGMKACLKLLVATVGPATSIATDWSKVFGPRFRWTRWTKRGLLTDFMEKKKTEKGLLYFFSENASHWAASYTIPL